MNVLVFNVGSTTLKYALIDSTDGNRLTGGMLDRIGEPGGDSPDHVSAAEATFALLGGHVIDAIGHRIVHGGERFDGPTVVDTKVLEQLAELDSLAPLHNPHARKVVEGLVDSGITQTLVFDTAYFSTLSPDAYRYALPERLYQEHHVRRYGFHGTSHQWIVRIANEYLVAQGDTIAKSRDAAATTSDPAIHSTPIDASTFTAKIISLHLGGGCSATASVGGVAVDTSMGMTPLEGLVMASRCGDIDPAIVLHLMRRVGMSLDEVDRLINRQSGLLGICGDSDMRAVLRRRSQGDASATLAVDLYVRKIVKTIGGLHAILGGLDALVFSAGVGEHSHEIRRMIGSRLGHLGIAMDDDRNVDCGGQIPLQDLSANESRVRVLVVATDEELAIARQVVARHVVTQ